MASQDQQMEQRTIHANDVVTLLMPEMLMHTAPNKNMPATALAGGLAVERSEDPKGSRILS